MRTPYFNAKVRELEFELGIYGADNKLLSPGERVFLKYRIDMVFSDGALSEFYKMHPCLFFSPSRICALGFPHNIAIKINKCMRKECVGPNGIIIKNMREFLWCYSLSDLSTFDWIGPQCVEAVVHTLNTCGLLAYDRRWRII